MSELPREETTLPTNSMKVQGKVAIITGGASGIGEATAHLFALHGARAVVIADVQDEKGLKVAEAIGKDVGAFFHCDVADDDQVRAAVDWTAGTYGQLDVMFCNAGVLNRSDQTVLDLDLSQLDRLFAINVRGVAAGVKHAARAMVERRVERRVRGSIVCTASILASMGARKWTDYVMAKHAVVGLVREASRQLGEHGIRVNCVSPYAVATPMTCSQFEMDAAQLEQDFGQFAPLKGVVLKAEHVAEAVLFLASDESAFVSGRDLVVDGAFLCGDHVNEI
ncbi:(-)-isopiperitenol/(-)-carveol dehydrogenase, mitochondrial-like [Diospyros lotus]|uniref:(-)-isopiperitenol/(-)-carveol dehydrogenase, mitochondrial-like n=1 Tax=Diospyros lotus TaxID=55363 RepID=UPI002257579E|nr:(-)-isopiperitenol/(-)-carveol dehydrogenase, mitochondrial-like [Diospyros lotus]